MATSPALINSSVRHQVYLERIKSGHTKRIENFLIRIDRSLRKRLGSKDLTEFTRQRLEKLLVVIDNDLKTLFSGYQSDLESDLVELSQYEAGFESRNINNVLTGGFETIIPSARQVRAAIFAAPLSVRGVNGGKLLKPFIKDWTTTERTRFIGVIRQGFFEGQTNFEILRNLRGTKARNFNDGALAIGKRHAEAIARTSIQHVASTARVETWKENSDIVKGYRWVSTLDSRTSTICRSLDGQVFKIDSGPVPPAHIRCRSTTIAELDGRFGFLKEGRTRSSVDGSIDANTTYYDWLKKQPKAFQEDALGKTRAKLFRDGGLTAQRFKELNLDKNFMPLSLAEMRKLEPKAFELAFDE